MVKTYFQIGDRDWTVVAYLSVEKVDLEEIYDALLSAGNPDNRSQEACMELSKMNSGYTFTNFDTRMTVIVTSKATSSAEAFDSIIHEIKHLVEHVSTYYDLDPKEELSAYLQGEVGRQLFPATALVICPKCNHHDYKSYTYR